MQVCDVLKNELHGYIFIVKMAEITAETAIYTKYMLEKEFLMFSDAAAAGIAPKMISFEKAETKSDTNLYKVVMEKFPKTLCDVLENERGKYVQRIYDLYKGLFKLNIFYVDVHEENIVIDEENDKIAIIDFGGSFRELDDDNLKASAEFFHVLDKKVDAGEKITFEDYLYGLKEEIKFICHFDDKIYD
jgi:hypothetical protein